MAFQIRIDDLTLEETELMCEYFGIKTMNELQRFGKELEDATDVPIKALRFFLWLSKKQEDPGFTIEQAGQLSMTAMQEMADAVPNAEGGEAAASSESFTPQSSSSTAVQSRRKRSGV